MKTTSVVSSNIVRIGHKNKTLYAAFHHGGVYKYEGVTEQQFLDFAAARSAGVHFHQNIKDQFPSVKLETGDPALAELSNPSNQMETVG